MLARFVGTEKVMPLKFWFGRSGAAADVAVEKLKKPNSVPRSAWCTAAGYRRRSRGWTVPCPAGPTQVAV